MNTDAKPHSLYCRYNSLGKRPPVPEGLNVPDLEELIKRATEEGKLTGGNKRAAPSTPRAKGAAAGTPGSNKRKAPATPKGGKAAKVAKVVKQEEESDGEEDPDEAGVESDEEVVKDKPEMEDADEVAA
jgi:hypothetical protein